jgi:hypothetical protein
MLRKNAAPEAADPLGEDFVPSGAAKHEANGINGQDKEWLASHRSESTQRPDAHYVADMEGAKMSERPIVEPHHATHKRVPPAVPGVLDRSDHGATSARSTVRASATRPRL